MSIRLPSKAQMVAAAGLLVAVGVYALVLVPITDVFTDPIHANPVTAFGKLAMARVGPLQLFAVIATVALLIASAVCGPQVRRRLLGVSRWILFLGISILGLECLMILGWLVTLWPYSDAAAQEFGRRKDLSTSLWPTGWHSQIVAGLPSLSAAFGFASVAILRAFRAESHTSP